MKPIPAKYINEASKTVPVKTVVQYVDTSLLKLSSLNLATAMSGLTILDTKILLDRIAELAAVQCAAYNGDISTLRMKVRGRYEYSTIPGVDGGLMMCFDRPQTENEHLRSIQTEAIHLREADTRKADLAKKDAIRIKKLEAELEALKSAKN